MEKRFLKIFNTQEEYDVQNEEVMGKPHVVLLKDTKEVIYEPLKEQPSIDYSKEFFTIEALEDGTVGIGIPYNVTSLKYRKNNEPWIETSEAVQLSVVANDTIQISCMSGYFSDECSSLFDISAPFNVKGNIMSLLYGDDFEDKTDLSGKDYAFSNLFINHPTLQNAENLILPATTLAASCYGAMFNDCTSLTTAPELPATTLSSDCYRGMFMGCTNLTTAPELLAPELANNCYHSMFYDCSKLNYITMLATDISAFNCLDYWVKNVASSGTFVKNVNMTSLPSGESGIPNEWTVQNY